MTILHRITGSLFLSLVALVAFFADEVICGERPGFAFLNTEMDARASGFSGALVGMNAELQGVFHNPASLAGLEGWKWSAGYTNHLLDVSGGSAVLAKTTRMGVFALGAASMDYGTFERLDDAGRPAGADFSASDAVIAAGFGKTVTSEFSIGMNIKGIFSDIDAYSASAFAFDFGFIYHDPGSELTVGAGIFGIGKSSAFISTEEPLPASYRLGASKRLAHLPLMLTVEGIRFTYGEWKALAGGEFMLSPNFRIRLGMNSSRFDLTTDILPEDTYSGVSLGFGLLVDRWRADYAVMSYGGAGSVQRFGITGGF